MDFITELTPFSTLSFTPIFQVFKIAVPQIENRACPPAFDIRAGIKPGGDPGESAFGIIGRLAEFDDYVDLIFRHAPAATASIAFNRFKDERILKGVRLCLGVAEDNELSPPLGEFTSVLLLAQSLLHLSLDEHRMHSACSPS